MAAEAIAATAAVGVEGEWAVAVEDEAVVAKRHRRGMSEALCFFFTRTIIKTIPGLRHGFYWEHGRHLFFVLSLRDHLLAVKHKVAAVTGFRAVCWV